MGLLKILRSWGVVPAQRIPAYQPRPWTEALLADVADLKPEDVFQLDDKGEVTPQSRNNYREISYARRLAWRYGAACAVERLNAPGQLVEIFG